MQPKILKHSFSNVAPAPNKIQVGELVLRIWNKEAFLYTKNADGLLIEVGQGILNFADLEDVDLTNLQEESFFVFRNGKFIATSQIGTLSNLADVEISNPEQGEYLRYDSFTESWKNYNASYYLSDIVDVDIADSSNDDDSFEQNDKVLVYNHPDRKFEARDRRNRLNDLDDVEVIPPKASNQLLVLDSDETWKNLEIKLERDAAPKLGGDLNADRYSIINSAYKVRKVTANQPIVDINYTEADYWIVTGVDNVTNPQCILNLNIFPKVGTTAILMLEIQQNTGNILIAGVENIHYEDGKPIQLSGNGKTDLITVMIQDAVFVQRRFFHENSISLLNRNGPLYPVIYPSLAHANKAFPSDVLSSTRFDLGSIDPFFGITDIEKVNTLLSWANTEFNLNWVAIINTPQWRDQSDYFAQFNFIEYEDSISIASQFNSDLLELLDSVWQDPDLIAPFRAPTTNETNTFLADWSNRINGPVSIVNQVSVPGSPPMRGGTANSPINNAGTYTQIRYLIYDLTRQSYISFLNYAELLRYTYTGSFSIPEITNKAIYQTNILKYDGNILYPVNQTAITNCRNKLGEIFGSQYFNTTSLPPTYSYRENAFIISDNNNWLNYFQSIAADFDYNNTPIDWYTSPNGLSSNPIKVPRLPTGTVGYPFYAMQPSREGSLVYTVMRLLREVQTTFSTWRSFITTWRSRPNYLTWLEVPDWLRIWERTAVASNYFNSPIENSPRIDIWRVWGNNLSISNSNSLDEYWLLTPFNRAWRDTEWDRPFDIGRHVKSVSIAKGLPPITSGNVKDIDGITNIPVSEFIRRHGWQTNMVSQTGSSATTTSSVAGGDFNRNTIKEGDTGGFNNQGDITGTGWVYSTYQDRYKAYITTNALNLAKSGLGGTPAYRYDKNRFPAIQSFALANLYDPLFSKVRLLLNFEEEESTGRLWFADKSDFYDEVNDESLLSTVITNTTQTGIDLYSFGIQDYVARFLTTSNNIDITFPPNLILEQDFTVEFFISFQVKGDYLSPTNLTYTLFENQDNSFSLAYTGSSNTSQNTLLTLKIANNLYVYDNAYKYFSNEENRLVHIAIVRKLSDIYLFVNGIYQNPNTNPTTDVDIVLESLNINLKGDINSFRITEDIARYENNFTPPSPRFGLLGGDVTIHDKIIFNTAYNLGDYGETLDDYIATQIFY